MTMTDKLCASHKLSAYIYRIRQNVRGGKLSRFSQILLNCESFPTNYGLVDWQYKSTGMLT